MREPINNFQTMPLRFRVWDETTGKFFVNEEDDGTEFDLTQFFNRLGGEFYLRNEWVISQDTGLKDKNRKNIYTGDIIKYRPYSETKTGVIRYDLDLGMMTVENVIDSVDVDAVGNIEGLCRIDIRQAEIIGNIWQNPELLKGEYPEVKNV